MVLLEKGGFRRTKRTSNSREVLASIPEDKRARPTINLDLDELPIERALGALRNVEKDVFQFEVLKPDKPAPKRGILSAISSLYHPMGFVCPVVLEAKNIIQRLWKLQLPWDDPVPECELAHWERWKSELSALTQVQIPNYLNLKMLRQLYYTLIYPCLNYGAMCWGNNYQTNLNKICTKQNKCIRSIFFAKKQEPSLAYYHILEVLKF